MPENTGREDLIAGVSMYYIWKKFWVWQWMSSERACPWPSLFWAESFQKLIENLLYQLESRLGPFVPICMEKRAMNVNAGQAQDVMEEVILPVMSAEAET